MPRSLLNAPHQTLEMRQAGLSTAILLLGFIAAASGNRSTAKGPSEEFATSEAMLVMPKGQRSWIHSSKALMSEPATAFSSAPSLTAPELINEGLVFGLGDVGLTSRRASRI